MLARLAALFVIVPALELYLLIKLGSVIGAAETFGVILLTGLVGSYLAKSQGMSVWRRFQGKLGSGSVPGTELVDGVIILISAALLITPGILTDVLGFLGLIPGTRFLLRKYLYARFFEKVSITGMQFSRTVQSHTNNGFKEYPGMNGAPGEDSKDGIYVGGKAKKRPGQDPDADPLKRNSPSIP